MRSAAHKRLDRVEQAQHRQIEQARHRAQQDTSEREQLLERLSNLFETYNDGRESPDPQLAQVDPVDIMQALRSLLAQRVQMIRQAGLRI